MNFQTIILKLQKFWADQNCIMGQPYDVRLTGVMGITPIGCSSIINIR